MATTTLRPNGTDYQGLWTVGGGAGSAHAATSDNNDATYIQAAPGGWLAVLDIADPALAEGAQIRSVAVRVRRVGDGSTPLDVAVGYQPPSGDYQSVVLSSGETPSSTIATRTYGSLSTAPGGAAWTETILGGFQVAFGAAGTALRIHEVYVDVEYDEAPTCVITSPVGTASSQQPTVTARYVDPDGAPLERMQVRVFTAAAVAAAGFTPDTTAATWDSGAVLTSTPSVQVGTPLAAGDWWVYARVSDAGSGGRFGLWASASFSVSASTLPATPTMAVAVDSSNRRVAVTVTPRDNLLSYGQSTGYKGSENQGDGWYADDLSNSTVDNISTDAASSTVTETFTGADGALSAANTDLTWTVVANAFNVASNQLTSPTASAIAWARCESDLGSPDHYAEVTINAMAPATNRTVMLWLRVADSGTSGYIAELKEQVDAYVISRIDGSTWHSLTGKMDLPEPLSLPATWRAEIRGNEIGVYLDGTLLGVHELDGALTTEQKAGVGIYNGGSTVLVDDWEAGDLTQVVEGTDTGEWLVRATSTNGRQVRATSGTRYGWGTPAIGGEIVTITAAAWQSADAARPARTDVEWYGTDDNPLTNLIFSESWPGDDEPWDADWTFTFAGTADARVNDGQGQLITGTSAYTTPSRMYCSGMSSMTDCEVLVKVRLSSTTAEMRAIVAVRTNGTWSGSDPGHPAAGYWAEVDSQDNILVIRKGGSTVLATPGKTCPTQGLWVRLRAQGTTIAAKAWPVYEQEPMAWDYIGEDSTYTSGRISLTAQNGADAVSRTVTFDDLTADDLSQHSFGSTFTTATDGSLTTHSRNAIVPASASYGKMSLIGFPTAGGEAFLWDYMGIVPGSNRPWSRGGIGIANVYTTNESCFEDPSQGVAGWAAGDDAQVARGTGYGPAASGAALELSWTGTSFSPGVVVAVGPAKTAAAGEDWAVGGWLWRASGTVTLLKIGIRFDGADGAPLATSYGSNTLPEVDAAFADAAHTARAPAGTAQVRAVMAATPVPTLAAAITAIRLVPGTVAPPVYQPGPAARSYALVEYSDDGGVSWAEVRGTRRAYYPTSGPSRAVTVYDYAPPPGVARMYRASTAATDHALVSDGAAAVSVPTGTVSATLPADRFWLRDPLTPARLIEVHHAGDLDHVSREPQEIRDTLGRAFPVAVSDVVKGETFTWPLLFTSAAGWRQFSEMRAQGRELLFTGDFGEQWYVKLGPDRRAVLKRSSDRAATPVRMVEITATQVDPPDIDLISDDVVTDLVWELV